MLGVTHVSRLQTGGQVSQRFESVKAYRLPFLATLILQPLTLVMETSF
jgi:hypothetical protein